MRVAVVSDIHGNLHALEAVLDALELPLPAFDVMIRFGLPPDW